MCVAGFVHPAGSSETPSLVLTEQGHGHSRGQLLVKLLLYQGTGMLISLVHMWSGGWKHNDRRVEGHWAPLRVEREEQCLKHNHP